MDEYIGSATNRYIDNAYRETIQLVLFDRGSELKLTAGISLNFFRYSKLFKGQTKVKPRLDEVRGKVSKELTITLHKPL